MEEHSDPKLMVIATKVLNLGEAVLVDLKNEMQIAAQHYDSHPRFWQRLAYPHHRLYCKCCKGKTDMQEIEKTKGQPITWLAQIQNTLP